MASAWSAPEMCDFCKAALGIHVQYQPAHPQPLMRMRAFTACPGEEPPLTGSAWTLKCRGSSGSSQGPWSLSVSEEHVGQRWEAEFFKVKRLPVPVSVVGTGLSAFQTRIWQPFLYVPARAWLRPDMRKVAMPHDPATSPPSCSWPLTEQFGP